MTVGSVRGNERLEMLLRVMQAERSVGADEGVEPMKLPKEAMSFGGQIRFMPAWMESVGWPQEAQYGFRAFQSRRARA